MQYVEEKGVLHCIYKKLQDIPQDLIKCADAYEGHIEGRIGFNLPIRFLTTPITKIGKKIEYIIVYKKGDILTKRHEMCHARYAMDATYREDVKRCWDSKTEAFRQRVKDMLKKMKYPERDEIILDEFQAYYFTEKGLFGKE
jgi:hypothetical protein